MAHERTIDTLRVQLVYDAKVKNSKGFRDFAQSLKQLATDFQGIKIGKSISYLTDLIKGIKTDNIQALKDLDKLEWTNLKNLKINKETAQRIRDLADAYRALKAVTTGGDIQVANITGVSTTTQKSSKNDVKLLNDYTKAIKEYYDAQKALFKENTDQIRFDGAKYSALIPKYEGLATILNDTKQRFDELTESIQRSELSEAEIAKATDAAAEAERKYNNEITMLALKRENAAEKAAQRTEEKARKTQEAAERAAARAEERAAKAQAEADAKDNQRLEQAIALQTKYNSLLMDSMRTRKGKLLTDSVKDDTNSLYQLIDAFKRGEISSEEFDTRLKALSNSFERHNVLVSAATDTSVTFASRIKTATQKLASLFGVARLGTALFRYFRDAVKESIELESTFNRLQIVTGATDAQMQRFAETAFSLAKSLGQDVNAVTGAIETFSRLGYSLEDASKLAQYATIMANVANVDMESATTGITAIVKGFNMDVQNVEHVADVLINVGQKYAVSASEMMEAYEKSGAALNATNTSFEKSAGLIAAANAAVQNASVTGTALKTVSARIRGSKSDLQELGEDVEDLADGFSKYAAEIKALTNVDIMVEGSTNSFKDLYDIMHDIAGVWDNLTDTQRARVSEILGGTRQLQVISSILGNWKDAAGAYEDALNSAGVATQANNKHMETAAAKIEQFKTQWQELAKNLVSSNLTSFFVQFGTSVVSALSWLAKINAALPITIAAIGLYNAARSARRVNTLADQLSVAKDVALNQAVAQSVQNLTLREKELLVQRLKRLVVDEKISKQQKDEIVRLYSLAAAEANVANKASGVSAAGSVLAGISKISIVLTVLSVLGSLITGVIIPAIKKAHKSLEELNSEFKEISDNARTAINDFQNLKSSAEEIIPRFAELAKGVDEFGRNTGKLSDEEYAEFVSLNNQLAELFPDLGIGMDSNGVAMLKLSYSSDTLTESLNALIEAERKLANEKLADGLADAFDNAAERAKRAQKEIDDTYYRKEVAKSVLDAILSGKNGSAIWNAVDMEAAGIGEVFLHDLGIDYDVDEVDWQKVVINGSLEDAAAAVEQYINGLERIYNSKTGEVSKIWSGIIMPLQAYAQTTDEYNALSTEAQGIINKVIAGIDFSAMGLKKGDTDAVKQFVASSIIQPIYDSSDDIDNAFVEVLNLKKAFENGEISPIAYARQVNEVLSEAFKGVQFGDDVQPTVISAVFDAIIQGFSNVGRVAKESKLPDYFGTLSKLEEHLDLLKEAASEEESGGLSVKTINSIKEAVTELTGKEDEYINYLYEENGAIKLNKQAYEELIFAKSKSELEAAKANIARLEKERSRLLSEKDSAVLPEELNEINGALETNTKELEKYRQVVVILQGALDGLDEASPVTKTYRDIVDNYKSEITTLLDSVTEELTKVADLQDAVANGFTLSLEKAREFADVYPEILDNATLTADGQIALNEETVNAFIAGKEAEQHAAIDAKIQELESERSAASAYLQLLQTQLDAAQAGDLARLNGANALVKALISNGVEEVKAFELGCEAMTGDTAELAEHIMQACIDSDNNINRAAYNAAMGVVNNSEAMRGALTSIIERAHNAARAVSGIANGEIRGSANAHFHGAVFDIDGDGVPDQYDPSGSLPTLYHGGGYSFDGSGFNGYSYDYAPELTDLEDYINRLNVDIEAYRDAIANIDGQIALLRALRERGLAGFSSGSGGSGSGSGSGSSGGSNTGSSDSDTNWFTTQYKLHQHLRNMDMESTQDYIEWLNSAYQQAYEQGLISLDDFMRYQEEVFRGLRDLFADYLSDAEHEISMLGHFEGNESEIIAIYHDLLEAIEAEIENARAQGLTDTDDYLQELQNKWWSYHDAIEDIQNSIQDNAKDSLDKLVQIRVNMIKDELSRERESLKERLDYLREFYNKQKNMLQQQYDDEKYLAEQEKKRRRIADLQAELERLRYDDSAWAQKRRLELEQELAEAQEDLNDYEHEHAIQSAQDFLDTLYEQQEDEINSEINLLEQRERDSVALYQQALDDIRNGSIELYEEMIEWNLRFGDGIEETITNAWEEAYISLQAYRDLLGELYEGIDLGNYTGYTPGDSWDDSPINGHGEGAPGTGRDNSGGTSQNGPAPGDSVQVKNSATNYSPKSGGISMPSYVPGGTYTVYRLDDDEVLIGRDGVYTGWVYKHDLVGYKRGTSHALPGIKRVNELGPETIFTSSNGSSYRLFSGGEKVLNAKSSEFLYKFATSGGSILMQRIRDFFSGSGLHNLFNQSRSPIEVSTGDIIINGNANQETVSELRRAQRDMVNTLLKEFQKLKR